MSAIDRLWHALGLNVNRLRRASSAGCACPDGLTDSAKACDRCRPYVQAKRSMGATTWTDEQIREAERQSSANGRIAGFAQRVWREQGYDEETVQALRRGLLDGLYEVQQDIRSEGLDREFSIGEATRALDDLNAHTAQTMEALGLGRGRWSVNPGGQPPRADGGPTARGVAFCLYGSQTPQMGPSA